jgi:WD40 repeat protein
VTIVSISAIMMLDSFSAKWLLTAGALLLSACSDPPAQVVSLGSQGVLSARLSPTTETALVGTVQHGTHVWDLRNGQLVATLNHAPQGTTDVVSSAFSLNARHIVTAERNNLIRWDMQNRQESGHWATTGVVRALAIDKQGQRIIAGLSDLSAWVVDASGRISPAVIPHSAAVGAVAISQDGKIGLTGTDDGHLRAWNLETGQALWRWTFNAAVATIALSPNEQYVFVAPFHGPGRIGKLQTGEVLVEKIGKPRATLLSSRFSPDGKELLTGSPNGELTVWSAETGKRLARWQAPKPTLKWPSNNVLLDVGYIPDKQQVAATMSSGQVAIWPR